jgi:hypothetical protein
MRMLGDRLDKLEASSDTDAQARVSLETARAELVEEFSEWTGNFSVKELETNFKEYATSLFVTARFLPPVGTAGASFIVGTASALVIPPLAVPACVVMLIGSKVVNHYVCEEIIAEGNPALFWKQEVRAYDRANGTSFAPGDSGEPGLLGSVFGAVSRMTNDVLGRSSGENDDYSSGSSIAGDRGVVARKVHGSQARPIAAGNQQLAESLAELKRVLGR